MKKIWGSILIGLLILSGCSKEAATNVRISALKGPTAMGMVQMMAENYEGYEFEMVANVDEVVAKIGKGEVDIAALPANMASVLYNNTDGNITVLGINTLGVLYICENGDSIHSISDLKGKTIYASGKGATPEYGLNYILAKAGIEDEVNIEWKSEHTECVSAMLKDPEAIAMLPQPFVSSAQAQNENIRVALDLTAEWEKLDSGSTMITGVIIARKEFVEENKADVDEFLNRYKISVDYVNENIDEAAKLVGEYDIVAEAVARRALPECNITLITGKELKEKLGGYLEVLFAQDPKAVGGSLPDDGFYYEGE